MTVEEAYKKYLDYYKNNQWDGEDIIHYLKKNWIDYEEYSYGEFKEQLLFNDKLNDKWGNGCTRNLSLDERFKLWEEMPDRDVMDFPIGELTEEQYHQALDQIGVPARVIAI